MTGPGQTRPDGAWWPIDAAWKQELIAELKQRGMTPTDLARRVGCTRTAIATILRPETRVSRLVEAIHQALERPAPAWTTALSCGVLRQLTELWPALSIEQRESVLATARAMAPTHNQRTEGSAI